MNEASTFHAVRTYFSARRRRSVRRLELMKLERERRRREFVRRKRRERLMFVFTIATVLSNLGNERVLWTMARSSHWWEEVVCGSFSSEQWLENFRMSRTTFHYLCAELRSMIEREDTRLRKAIPTEKTCCSHSVVRCYWCRLPNYCSSVWSVQVHCLVGRQRRVICLGISVFQ